MKNKSIYIFLAIILIAGASAYTVNLKDWVKVQIVSPLEENGAVAVNVQDQATPAFDLFFSKLINYTYLDSDAIINEYSINATTGHGITVGEQLVIIANDSDRAYIGNVISIAGNIINLDRPLNVNYTASETRVARTNTSLNVDGSTTRQTFVITAPGDIEIDVTRILFQMITDTQPDFAKFGDISGGLTRGLAVRVTNGRNTNLFNVKTNGELVNLMYDVTFYDRSNPAQGVYGLGGRLTYGGQEKHGVVLRLEANEFIEVIVQDDLTSLIDFKMVASGHIVEDIVQ